MRIEFSWSSWDENRATQQQKYNDLFSKDQQDSSTLRELPATIFPLDIYYGVVDYVRCGVVCMICVLLTY